MRFDICYCSEIAQYLPDIELWSLPAMTNIKSHMENGKCSSIPISRFTYRTEKIEGGAPSRTWESL
jgi:hypothetical protein